MYTVTIEGETLEDIALRANELAKALIITSMTPEASAPSEPEADPPATKTRKRKSQAKIAAEMPGETIVEPDAEHHEEEPEFDRVAAAGVKEKALDKIRAVYALGPEGATAVTKLGKDYGVKKLGDVPLEQAEKLLADIIKIEKAVSKNSPI